MHIRRAAGAHWQGNLRAGAGKVSLASRVSGDLPYSLETRKAEASKSTSPEELLAAAHAACFAMSVRAVLDAEAAGGQPAADTVDVDATCILRIDASGWTIEEMALTVRIDGFSPESVERIAVAADTRCPISSALRGSVRITVSAAQV